MEFTSISPDLIRGKVETMIMKCLGEKELYGLEICDAIKDASGGTYVMKLPTLYSALTRLEKKKYVESYKQQGPHGSMRKYFRLTDLGRNSFNDNKGDWRFSKEVIDNLIYDNITRHKFQDTTIVDESLTLIKNHQTAMEEEAENLRKANQAILCESENLAAANEALEKLNHEQDARLQELLEQAKRHIVETHEQQQPTLSEQAAATTAQAASTFENALTHPASYPAIPVASETTNGGVQYVTQYFIQGDYNSGVSTSTTTSYQATDNVATAPVTQPVVFGSTAPATDSDYFTCPLAGEQRETFETFETRETTVTPYVLNQEPEPKKEREIDWTLNRYISPNEYVTVNRQPHMAVTQPKPIAESVIEPIPMFVAMRPHVKHADLEKTGLFVLYNKLKAACSLAVCTVLVIALLFIDINLRSEYSAGESVFFTLAFIALGAYLLFNMGMYLIWPQYKKINANYKREFIIRAIISGALVAFVLAVNLIAGLTSFNYVQFIVFFLVPAIVSLSVFLDGVAIYLFKKHKIFLAP